MALINSVAADFCTSAATPLRATNACIAFGATVATFGERPARAMTRMRFLVLSPSFNIACSAAWISPRGLARSMASQAFSTSSSADDDAQRFPVNCPINRTTPRASAVPAAAVTVASSTTRTAIPPSAAHASPACKDSNGAKSKCTGSGNPNALTGCGFSGSAPRNGLAISRTTWSPGVRCPLPASWISFTRRARSAAVRSESTSWLTAACGPIAASPSSRTIPSISSAA